MITVYEIKPNGYLGTSKQIDPREGAGIGWTYSAPSNTGPHEWVNGDWQPREREPEPSNHGPDLELLAATVRQQRSEKLIACDWTQGKDIPDSISNLWAEYRQQLRDITLQPWFPVAVEWPQPPQ